jgi:hypothetical protein
VGFGGRRQSSVSGTSRMNREVHVRFCERLGVKFPGPTRPWATLAKVPIDRLRSVGMPEEGVMTRKEVYRPKGRVVVAAQAAA